MDNNETIFCSKCGEKSSILPLVLIFVLPVVIFILFMLFRLASYFMLDSTYY